MKITETDILGVFIIEPHIYRDGRGYFFESFSQKEFQKNVSDTVFVQDNESLSVYGVVRGLHFQLPPFAQSKLVRVAVGKVVDVAVDLRIGSPSYGKHISVELSADNHKQLFMPKGIAHGFGVLSEKAVFQYKCDNFYSAAHESAINWDDEDLAIDWRIPAGEVTVSEKDRHNQPMKDFKSPFLF